MQTFYLSLVCIQLTLFSQDRGKHLIFFLDDWAKHIIQILTRLVLPNVQFSGQCVILNSETLLPIYNRTISGLWLTLIMDFSFLLFLAKEFFRLLDEKELDTPPGLAYVKTD